MISTHINENVLEFYNGLPFNYRDSVEEHALSVIKKTRWAGEAYEMIAPMLKPKTKPKTKYPILKKATKGYVFQDGDIHWPNKIEEGGETWQIEHE